MFIADSWRDFEVLDTGDGSKLERWGDFILSRPDPVAIWPVADHSLWRKADGVYVRSGTGGGAWDFKRHLPERWEMRYNALKFYVRTTGFKHTGLFPEQAANWDFMMNLIRHAGRPIKALNLFAYTGGATLVCCLAGAHTTHVDAAKGMVTWAKENYSLSGLYDTRVRWIVDDVMEFVSRQSRRGGTYDAIIMDPPAYGRGPDGEMWKLERNLYSLVESCAAILSDTPLFFLINSYTTGLSPAALTNVITRALYKRPGNVECQELCLPVKTGGVLPCGATARWTPSYE